MGENTSLSNDRSAQAMRPLFWPVIAASWVGLFFHFGSLLVNTFGIFLTTLTREFGWSRTEVTLAFTLAMITAMIGMPLAGWISDHVGSRRLIILTMISFGVMLTAMSLLSGALWQLLIIFLIIGLVGPGTSAIPHANLISRWRSKRHGLALGIAMSGTACGGVIWPVFAQSILDRFGYRISYLLLGGSILLLAVPIILLLLREAPDPSQPDDPSASAPMAGMSRREAITTTQFWILTIAFLIFMSSVQACLLHLVPLLTDQGMEASKAAGIASLLGLAGIAGRIITGYLLDLINPTIVPVIAFLIVALGMLMLATGTTGLPAVIAALLIGFGYGADAASIPCLVARFFGMRSFGEIYSYIFIAVPLGGAIGPALMSAGFDQMGDYRSVLIGSSLLTILAAGMMLRLTFPGSAPDRLREEP